MFVSSLIVIIACIKCALKYSRDPDNSARQLLTNIPRALYGHPIEIRICSKFRSEIPILQYLVFTII